MYVAITSPYPWDRGVTQWYQSLGSHLVWVTTWVNTRALTTSTIRFRFKLDCIWIWDSSDKYKNTISLKIHSWTLFNSLISVVNQNLLIFFFLSLHPIDSKPLSLTHDTNLLAQEVTLSNYFVFWWWQTKLVLFGTNHLFKISFRFVPCLETIHLAIARTSKFHKARKANCTSTVSYTHLTLPTIYSV